MFAHVRDTGPVHLYSSTRVRTITTSDQRLSANNQEIDFQITIVRFVWDCTMEVRAWCEAQTTNQTEGDIVSDTTIAPASDSRGFNWIRLNWIQLTIDKR